MKSIHVSFDEHGLDGQWADLRDPRFLSKRTAERWQLGIADGTFTPESFLREFVAAWHILDVDSGEELNNPAADSIEGIPLVIFQVLNERIGQLFRVTLAATAGDRPDNGMADGDPGSSAPPVQI